MAIDAADRVALVRQWRLPADAALLEIPAGGLDFDVAGIKEDPDLAARRELEEETGVRAATWRKLGAFYSAPGFTDELMHLYLATDLSPASGDGRLGPDEDERLVVEWRPWPDAVAAAERGEIQDAKSIVGLFWLDRLRRGHDPTGPADTASAVPIASAGATTGEAVTVVYQMTTGEAVRASVGLARRSTGIRLFGVVTIALAGFGVLLGDLLSVVGVLLGVAIATGWAIAPLSWWQFRKRPDLIGAETTLTFDEGGAEIVSAFGRGRTAWSMFRKVQDVAGFFLFDNDAGVSMVVPKRAFTASELGVVYRLLDRNGLRAGNAG